MQTARGKHNKRWRQWGEAILDALLCQGLVAQLCFNIGLHGKLSVSTYDLKLPAHKRLAQPLKIAFLSDFHAGPTTDPRIFEQAFQVIREQEPALLLLGGDFISHSAHYITQLHNLFSELKPPLGSFAVLGNHDLWSDHQLITESLERAGVQVLINRNLQLKAPFDSISICGIDDPWTGDVNADACFKDAQNTRLLLMHAPDGLLFLAQHQFDFAFAGHTHGGQIAKSNGQALLTPHGPLSSHYVHGLFPLEGNGALIVSRGIGCSNVPIRIHADPELVFCTIE
jgi:predicted MPP superfamily phosphohydrolase